MGVVILKLTPPLHYSDHMKHVPEKLQEFRAEKKYYEATELLNNSGNHSN